MSLRRWVPTALLLVLAASPASGVVCPNDAELETARLINVERTHRGLGPLEVDLRLVEATVRHSEDMAAGCFLSHTGSDGSRPADRMLDAGYPRSHAGGEVAGAGYPSPVSIVAAWMDSPGHHAIIMGPGARHIGVGFVVEDSCSSGDRGLRVTQFWTANVGNDPGPTHGVAEQCDGEEPLPPVAACSDGLDNDGDGMVDFAEDGGCSDALDPSEAPDCSDGLDNDADGNVDFPADPGCWFGGASDEAPACNDGLDNDDDGRIDYPADDGCMSASQYLETDSRCGLGFELAVLLPVLMRWRSRHS